MTARRLGLALLLAAGLGLGAAGVADAGHGPSHYPPGNEDPGPPDGRDPGPPDGRGPRDRSASSGAPASVEIADVAETSVPITVSAVAIGVVSAAVGVGAIAKARGGLRAAQLARGRSVGRT